MTQKEYLAFGNKLVDSSSGLTVSTPDFGIAASALSPATVSAGGSSTSTITITSMNGFNGSVGLACSITGGGTPAPTCSFNPSSVASGFGTSTLTVSTTAPHVMSGASASLRPRQGFGWLAGSGTTLLVGFFVLGVPSRWRRLMAGLGLMLLVFFAAGIGCGGGSSSSGSAKTGGTPVGTYTITITATSASPAVSHTTTVTVQ